MKERPILFKPEMVRAILAGKKTQTRRVVEPLPEWFEPDAVWQFCTEGHGGRGWYVHTDEYPEEGSECYQCPYGEVGDRLWVRESWQYYDWTEDGEPWIRYAADNHAELRQHSEDWAERVADVWAKLSCGDNYNIDSRARDRKWRPSIFLPRWACRLSLEIVDVRVERLQDITEADAMAEGVSMEAGETDMRWNPVQAFRHLWSSIHSKDGCDWDQNPWLWVVAFKPISEIGS